MKKLLLMTLALTGLFMGSCLRDKFDGGTSIPGGKADFWLNLSLEELEKEMAMTRATVVPTPDEERVQNIVLLFFEKTPDASGQYLGAVTLDSGSGYQMNTDIPISFSGQPELDPMVAHNILILANAYESYLGVPVADWTASLSGKTEQRVFDESRATVSGALNNNETDNTHAIPANMIPMTARASRSSGQSTVSATMLRIVSRFDVINSIDTAYDLVSTSIWNAFPETSVFGGGVVDYSGSRIGRFYGVTNSSPYNDIIGGLYSFENRVASPAQNDEKTTCLIVGLSPRANVDFNGETWTAGTTKYFRVNINSIGSAQALKRNNAYKLTLRNVIGMGKNSEQEAFSGDSNNLIYVINYWDLDDDGLIVYDGTNLLAIPTKTARLAPEGETRQLSIFTFGNGTLAIKDQSYNSGDKIRATLNGNTLNIVAQPLGTDIERTGYVELSFAGLTAVVNIIQSGDSSTYLEVITPTGAGIPAFQPSAWYPSGLITVKASGSWTATIHMEGFSFSNSSNKTTLTSAEVPGNQFQIYTNSTNSGTTPREAFMLIRLDSDPDNFNAALLLTQKAAGAINLLPSQRTVAFQANRSLDVSQPSYSATQVFSVYPTIDNGAISGWKAEIIPATGATYDDSALFEFYNPATMTVGQVQSSTIDVEGNRVGVRPTAYNTQNRDLRATLKISLIDQPSVYTEVALIQKGFDISSTTVPAVSNDGGVSDVVNLLSSVSELKWQVQSIDTYTVTTPLILNYHEAKVQTQSGTAITPGAGSPVYDLSEGFRVEFPKVYYPNRDKIIYADVTLNIGVMNGDNFETQSTYTVSVQQQTLTARTISTSNTLNMRNGYASIGSSSSYFGYFRDMLTNNTVFGSNRTVPVGPLGNLNNVTTLGTTDRAIGTNVNYLHFNMPEISHSNTMYGYVNDWRAAIDGVWVISADITSEHINSLFYGNGTNTAANSPFNTWQISANGDVDDDTNRRTLNSDKTASTRIGQFLTDRGAYPVPYNAGMTYYANGVSAAANISNQTNGSNAVRIIGAVDTAVGLFVDPANRVVYIGEAEFFMYHTTGYSTTGPAGNPANNYDKFLANLVSYVFYTAAYGSHFSDLLIDGFALPAPWDPSWNQ